MFQSILTAVATLAAMIYVIGQARKPDRLLGRLFASMMNSSHSGLTDWGLTHVAIGRRFTILDVGCGGGKTIEKLAAVASEGRVYGVDYAAGSVAASRSKNAALIKAGRVRIEQASVSQMPFDADEFDLVTAVETQYYWPDLLGDMRGILRVLKPGGTLVVIAESYKGGSNELVQRPVMKLLGASNLSVDDQRDLFERAGFCDIDVIEEKAKGWICASGSKP